jgi:hypothetical protein
MLAAGIGWALEQQVTQTEAGSAQSPTNWIPPMIDQLQRIAAQMALLPTPEQWAELCERVAALEAARATRPTPPAPLSETLVARIQRRCGGGEEAARIAIHEVADWLRWISSISENNDALFQASLLIRKQADR